MMVRATERLRDRRQAPDDVADLQRILETTARREAQLALR